MQPLNCLTQNRSLPPKLDFLRKFAGPFPDEPLEFIESVRRLLEQVRTNRADVAGSGLDMDRFLSIEFRLAKLTEVEKRLETAQETHLQATADLADANYEAFKATEIMVQVALEINPLDPNVQEAREFVEEWRKWIPKN